MQSRRKYAIFLTLIIMLILLLYMSFNTGDLKKYFDNKIISVLSDTDKNKEQKESSTSTDTPSGDDMVKLLARLINGEARGEPYTGQVAVASVVLNRVKSSSFPNSIAGVIYQSGAFSVVNDGQINLTPNSTAKKAAQDAMNGWDPTYGAIYYFNPKTATNKWIWSRPVTVTIGNHRFCK